MSKLFKLKDWLTVPNAAKHLTIVFGEEVTEADVFRLALDRKLRISIYLSKPTVVKLAEKIPIPIELEQHIKYGNSMLCTKLDEITFLEGILDLPLIDYERSIVEAEYYRALNGSAIELTGGGSILVEQNGQLFELQVYVNQFRSIECNVDDSQEQLLKNIAVNNYCEAQSLPEHGTLIVRTDALRELEDSINGAPGHAEKPLSTTERHTLLTIIAALCEYSAISHQERGVAAQIARLTEEIGVPVSDDAIRKVLDKIPNALEARRK